MLIYFSYLAQVLYGWNLTVVNTAFSSILIRWTNLTSLINRKVGHYIVFLNRRNNSVTLHQVVNGDQLTTEINGIAHLTNYTVEVVGIDTLQRPYKTPPEAIMTANRKWGNAAVFLLVLFQCRPFKANYVRKNLYLKTPSGFVTPSLPPSDASGAVWRGTWK